MQRHLKLVFLTGGSSGIGACVLSKLLEQNYYVINLSRRPPPPHPNLEHHFCDLSDQKQSLQIFRKLAKTHGDKPSEGVILAAGVGHFGYLEQLKPESFQTTMAINFLSQALLVKCLIPSMKTHQAGSIIWMGSEAGLRGTRQGSAYCASKFASRGFCQALRDECRRDHIRVTYVAAGLVATPFFLDLNFEPQSGSSHAMSPEGIADVIVMLLNSPTDQVIEEIVLQPQQPAVIAKKPLY